MTLKSVSFIYVEQNGKQALRAYLWMHGNTLQCFKVYFATAKELGAILTGAVWR